MLLDLLAIFQLGQSMAIRARKKEGINRKNTIALILSLIGIIITVVFFACAFALTPSNIGLNI
jgi:hypothetical protein